MDTILLRPRRPDNAASDHPAEHWEGLGPRVRSHATVNNGLSVNSVVKSIWDSVTGPGLLMPPL